MGAVKRADAQRAPQAAAPCARSSNVKIVEGCNFRGLSVCSTTVAVPRYAPARRSSLSPLLEVTKGAIQARERAARDQDFALIAPRFECPGQCSGKQRVNKPL